MFLELAESPGFPDPYNRNNSYLMEEADAPYIWIPGAPGEEGVYVREDFFDQYPQDQFEEIMAYLEGAQQGMGGLFTKMRARRADRKANKQTRKLETIAARGAAGTGLKGALQGIGSAIGQAFGGGGQPTPIVPQPQQAGIIPAPGQMNWTPIIYGGIALVVVGGILMAQRRRKGKK